MLEALIHSIWTLILLFWLSSSSSLVFCITTHRAYFWSFELKDCRGNPFFTLSQWRKHLMSLKSVQLDHKSLHVPNLLCKRVEHGWFKRLVGKRSVKGNATFGEKTHRDVYLQTHLKCFLEREGEFHKDKSVLTC